MTLLTMLLMAAVVVLMGMVTVVSARPQPPADDPPLPSVHTDPRPADLRDDASDLRDVRNDVRDVRGDVRTSAGDTGQLSAALHDSAAERTVPVTRAPVIIISSLPELRGTKMRRHNIQKQFYQTPLGKCCGLKLQKCRLQLKNKVVVLFIIIFGTLSFSVGNHFTRLGRRNAA